MKTNLQHILAGAAAISIMVVESAANANVDTKLANAATFTPPIGLNTRQAINLRPIVDANQAIIRLAQKKISASKAKKIARGRVKGGEVVDISLKGSTYKVRVIAKNGNVVDVLIDANTGRVR